MTSTWGWTPVGQSQPVGRPAALAWGMALAAMVLPSSAGAQETDLARCLAIGNVEERVACYDAIARSQMQGPAALPSGPPQAAPAPAAAAGSVPSAPPAPTFGLSAARREALRDPAAQEPSEVAARVVSARQVGAGYWRFDLSDGTVWELAEVRRSFRPPRAGDGIVIRRGALGAFYLDADRQPAIRIRRLT